MHRLPLALALVVAAVALAVAACGDGAVAPPPGPETGAGGWRALPPSPLSPRDGAIALSIGDEVVFVGGSDARPCPPSAGCLPPDRAPLADGAAFRPATGSWQRIADAPVPVEWAATAVVGDVAYLLVPGNRGRPGAPAAFLAYRAGADRWLRLPAPPGDPQRDASLVAAGGGIVAVSGSDERGEAPDLLFDPAARAWSRLPPDPLSPSFDRAAAWDGREPVLFDHALVPNPGSTEPALTRAAALDLGSGSWRRLPDSDMLGTGPWFRARGRLVSPLLGGADGGEVNGWGRFVPYGGVLDPRPGVWSRLPDPPTRDGFGAGVLVRDRANYFGHRGWVLDVSAGRWTAIPELDRGPLVTGRSAGAAGRDLVVFGGARWEGARGALLDDAWAWSPPGQ
jgi:hypothetical protein